MFFFGGGFQFGDVSQFVPHAAYFASRGMVAARADYRVKSRHGVEPDACVEDAKSAVRWFRQNAAKLGIDSDRIVACGSSSGGYLAACTACTGLEPEGEDLKISSRASAMILVNPFLPFVKQKADWKIVPTLHLTKATPPTLILFGTKDDLLPRADEFMAKSKEVGHKAEMFLAEGVGHGFAGKSPWREKVIQREDEFLVSLGYLQGKPTIKVPDGKDEKNPQPKGKGKLPMPTFENVKYGPHGHQAALYPPSHAIAVAYPLLTKDSFKLFFLSADHEIYSEDVESGQHESAWRPEDEDRSQKDEDIAAEIEWVSGEAIWP